MTLEASKFASDDFISLMPDNVVSVIMDRLPLQDAVKTSILSRNWRFKWTMLSQLIFDWKFYDYLKQTKNTDNYGRIISMILLRLKGAITKFDLTVLDVEEFSHWILFLSEKRIKNLRLAFLCSGPYLKMPTHLFSCLELTHLKLQGFYINPPPSFQGFPNLLSLEMYLVEYTNTDHGEFFSRCPLLEVLTHFDLCPIKLVEIAKLKNLKILSLSLSDPETYRSMSSHSIFEVMGSLPKLQKLYLGFGFVKLKEDGAKRMFPTTFPHLKALSLMLDLDNSIMLSLVFEMIKRSASLQTLEVGSVQLDADDFPEVEYNPADQFPEVEYNPTDQFPVVEYNTTGLQSVVVKFCKGSENEVGLIKYILACSPILQNIVIQPSSYLVEWSMFARKLLKLHRASPIAEIDLK